MPRVHVYLPKELHQMLKEKFPDVSPSEALQKSLRTLAGCRHDRACCANCATPIDVYADVVGPALAKLGFDLLCEVEDRMSRNSSWEGFGMIVRNLCRQHGAKGFEAPLPRKTRAMRERHLDEDHARLGAA